MAERKIQHQSQCLITFLQIGNANKIG